MREKLPSYIDFARTVTEMAEGENISDETAKEAQQDADVISRYYKESDL